MATRNNTAISMTADLLNSALRGQPPAASPDASAPDAPPETPPPQNFTPVDTPPPPEAPPADIPPAAPSAPRVFDPASIQARFTQEPPPPAPADDGKKSAIPDVPPPAAPGKPADAREAYTWARLRTDVKTFEKAAEDARNEAAAAKEEARRAADEKAKIVEELETRKQREAELVEKIGRLSLAESPEFQQKFDLKLSDVQSRLGKALVKYAGVADSESMSQAAQIMAADPKALPDLLSDLNPSVAGMVLALTSEASAIDEARNQELANWRQTGAAASVDVARKSVVEQAESRRRMATAAIEAAKAYGNPVYAAEDPSVKEVADTIAQEFHGFAQTATEEQLIRAAAEGYAAPYLYDVVNQQQAEIMELRSQLAGRTRAANPPMFPSGGFMAPPAPPPAVPANVTPANAGASAQDFAVSAARDTIARFNGVTR